MRELRADLVAAAEALKRCRSLPPDSTARLRSWTDVDSLLDHDLDVHLPQALAMLGSDPDVASNETGNQLPDEQDPVAIAEAIEPLLAAAQHQLRNDPVRTDAVLTALALLGDAHQLATRGRALVAQQTRT